MTIEERYRELTQLKAKLIAHREHAVETRLTKYQTKDYYHVRKWSLALNVIVDILWLYWFVRTIISGDIGKYLGEGLKQFSFYLGMMIALISIKEWYDDLHNYYIHYAIEGGDFVSYNYRHKEKKRVNISNIQYIELLNVSKRKDSNALFRYDEHGCVVLGLPNNQEILSDILRINPDIEIRKES